MVVFQQLIIYSDFLEIIKCFKNSWFICGNISHHHSEFWWHKISLGVCINNMPLHIFNWLSIVTIMLIILYAFFFTSHTQSKKKKRVYTWPAKKWVYMWLAVYMSTISTAIGPCVCTISTAIGPCVCTYIFLYHNIHFHFAVANSFRETSVASPNKHLACIIPN